MSVLKPIQFIAIYQESSILITVISICVWQNKETKIKTNKTK